MTLPRDFTELLTKLSEAALVVLLSKASEVDDELLAEGVRAELRRREPEVHQ